MKKGFKIVEGLLSVSVKKDGKLVGRAIYAAGKSGWVVNDPWSFRELARFSADDSGKRDAIDFIKRELV